MNPRSTHIKSSCMTTSQKHINTDLRTTFRKLTVNLNTLIQTNFQLAIELNA